MPNKAQIKQRAEREKQYRIKRNMELTEQMEKISRALSNNNSKLQQLMIQPLFL